MLTKLEKDIGRLQRCVLKLGVIRQPSGRYLCGMEGCNKLCSLRAMRVHVPVCTALLVEERRLQAQRRDQTADRSHSQPCRRPAAAPPVFVGPSLARCRVTGKQPATTMGPCTHVNCRNFDLILSVVSNIAGVQLQLVSLH